MGRVRRVDNDQAEERILDFAPVSVKGQLVIPFDVRKLFNIEPGDRVAFVKKGEELVLRKAHLVIAKPPT